MNDDPELIHEIFSQFNETNNKFYDVEISKSTLSNFVFEESTTGKKYKNNFLDYNFKYMKESSSKTNKIVFPYYKTVIIAIMP